MKYVISSDPGCMNWFRPDYEYAQVSVPPFLNLEASVSSTREGDLLRTSVSLRNTGSKLCLIRKNEVGITFPLEDRYDSARVCLIRRCHAHVFCGENVSYICALRMGGDPPHLGMVLTKGSLSGYSILRNEKKGSNDRGCFLLHPSPAELEPGETMQLEWTVFPHDGWEDFYARASGFRPFPDVKAGKYVLFPGERTQITVTPNFDAGSVAVRSGNASVLPVTRSGNRFAIGISYGEDGLVPGENRLEIEADGIRTHCSILLQEDPEKLALSRCRFIARHQQYRGSHEPLLGAYLAYDCREGEQDYSVLNDHNAGRERAGMGLLMARYLQKHPDSELDSSLQAYTSFVLRELVDRKTGTVANDYRMDTSYKRLYNAPWYALFFLELYRLRHENSFLTTAVRIMEKYYRQGGDAHYSIEVPVTALCTALKEAGMEKEYAAMKALFVRHAERILENGLNYPPHEVDFEQSIVAPAAWILLEVYQLTGEQRYLEAAEKQMDILLLFNGRQPDHHLYETAIRHWDGYWFGKEKMFGDTFPHYWSSLTGNCMHLYGKLTGSKTFAERAEASLRSPLALIFPGGEASCAYLYPQTVNGRKAAFYDPCANDQDWALYYYLRYKEEENR